MRKGFETADARRERPNATLEEGLRIVGDRRALRRAGTMCVRCRTEPATMIDPTTERRTCEACGTLERHNRAIAAVRISRAATR